MKLGTWSEVDLDAGVATVRPGSGMFAEQDDKEDEASVAGLVEDDEEL